MAGKTENTPIPDAELAELRRLHAAAGLPDTISIRSATIRVHPFGPDLCSSDEHEASLAALHNAFGPLLARLEAAERDRDEASKENDFMRLRLAESDKACVYCDLPKAEMGACAHGFPGCARADDLFHCDELTRRDAQQRREGAIEAFNEMRRQAKEVGQQSGLAKKMCKIFADECIEQAAQRLREGGE